MHRSTFLQENNMQKKHVSAPIAPNSTTFPKTLFKINRRKCYRFCRHSKFTMRNTAVKMGVPDLLDEAINMSLSKLQFSKIFAPGVLAWKRYLRLSKFRMRNTEAKMGVPDLLYKANNMALSISSFSKIFAPVVFCFGSRSRQITIFKHVQMRQNSAAMHISTH